MKNILLLSSADCVHTLKWANGLASRGLNVTLITQQQPLKGYVDSVNILALPFTGKKGYILNSFPLRNILRKHKFDCVNVHYVSGYGVLARLAGLKGYVASVWGADVYDFPKKSYFHKKVIENTLNAAGVICSTSKVMAEYVNANLSVDKKIKIYITPFGINVSKFNNYEDRIEGANIKIGTVKTLRPKYGIDILIKAFHIVQKDYSNVVLDIAGIGYQLEELKELTAKLSLGDKVTFLGWVENDDVPKVLNTFDIYVAPSTLDSESFGVAILEASACEVPVIVSDVGGLPEVVNHNETGIVVERNNVLELSVAMRRLIDSSETRKRMGINGRQHVLNNYEWESCVEKMVKIYEINTLK